MGKKFEKKLIDLIKRARISCSESVAEDMPYEMAPELWSVVCEELGYYDYDTNEVVKE